MRTVPKLAHRAALAALFAPLLSAFARAQEPPPKPDAPPVPEAEAEDPTQKVIRLFGEVQKHLDEIDRLLLAASTKRSAEEIASAVKKMEELLRDAERNQSSTIEKIDEIIKNAPQQQGGGGSCPKPGPSGDGKPKPGEPKPQDPGQQGQRDQRSDKPQQLDDAQGQQKQGERPQDQQPQEGRKVPTSNRDSADPGRNFEGPDSARREGAKRDDPRGNWEVQLPRKQTEVFRNPLRDTQIPDRYHRWIERWRSRNLAERKNG